MSLRGRLHLNEGRGPSDTRDSLEDNVYEVARK